MLLWLLACTTPTSPRHPADPPVVAASDTATATGLSTSSDSADSGVPTTPLAFVEAPILGPNPHGAGLTALLTVRTTEPTTLELTVADRAWLVESPATAHELLLIGLPSTASDLTITALTADGQVSDTIRWQPEPLPAGPVFTAVSDPSLPMEPGVTLLATGGTLWMLDDTGAPVWYLPDQPPLHEITVTDAGTLLLQVGREAIEERALSGELLARLSTDPGPRDLPIDALTVHHDVVELPSGNLLTLGLERRTFPDYPASVRDPALTDPSHPVAGDVVLELDPSGGVVHQWSLFDRLDPYRIGHDGLSGVYWDAFFGDGHTHDWSHGNAIAYDPVRDEVVVSLRHQDAVVGIEHATGDVAWIVAPEANWGPTFWPLILRAASPTDRQPYHQHAAKITADGTLLLFDNGNGRASAYEPPLPATDNVSRCLELALDHDAGTWSTVWSWGQDLAESHFSGSLGDCDALPQTGHRLITFGNLGNPALPGARIVEVSREGQVVFDLAVDGTTPAERPSVYRAERVPDPTGAWPR